MTPVDESAEAPFSSRRGFFGFLAVAIVVLGVVVIVDVLPRVNPPPPKVEGTKLVPPALDPISEIRIVRGRKDFRLEDNSGVWEMIDAEGRTVIGNDRVEEFVATVRGLVQIVDIGESSEVSLADFGLADPREKLVLASDSGAEIQIWLGDRNPPLTGLYTLLLPEKRVVLVGAVLLLELDKLAALASVQAP